MLRYISYLYPVSAKFIGPSDRQDKYVIGPICLISSRTEMSDVASNTMYTMYTQSQIDISSVLCNYSPNRTECPMKFHKVSRTLYTTYLIKGMRPKICGNWVLIFIFKIILTIHTLQGLDHSKRLQAFSWKDCGGSAGSLSTLAISPDPLLLTTYNKYFTGTGSQ